MGAARAGAQTGQLATADGPSRRRPRPGRRPLRDRCRPGRKRGPWLWARRHGRRGRRPVDASAFLRHQAAVSSRQCHRSRRPCPSGQRPTSKCELAAELCRGQAVARRATTTPAWWDAGVAAHDLTRPLTRTAGSDARVAAHACSEVLSVSCCASPLRDMTLRLRRQSRLPPQLPTIIADNPRTAGARLIDLTSTS